MFYLAVLNKRLFDLEILLTRRGVLQCSNKFSNCFPRLGNRLMHRGVIPGHHNVWRFSTPLLKRLSRVSSLSADARSRQCTNSYDQIGCAASIPSHRVTCRAPVPTAIGGKGRSH